MNSAWHSHSQLYLYNLLPIFQSSKGTILSCLWFIGFYYISMIYSIVFVMKMWYFEKEFSQAQLQLSAIWFAQLVVNILKIWSDILILPCVFNIFATSQYIKCQYIFLLIHSIRLHYISMIQYLCWEMQIVRRIHSHSTATVLCHLIRFVVICTTHC